MCQAACVPTNAACRGGTIHRRKLSTVVHGATGRALIYGINLCAEANLPTECQNLRLSEEPNCFFTSKGARFDMSGLIAGSNDRGVEKLVDGVDHHGTFSHRRRHPLDGF